GERVDDGAVVGRKLLVRDALQVDGALAPPGACPLARGRAFGMKADVDVLAPGPDARVQIEEGDAARALQMRFDRRPERAVGPLLARAAVEDAVLVRVLPAVERVRKRLLADALAIRVELGEGTRDRLFVPVPDRDCALQLHV